MSDAKTIEKDKIPKGDPTLVKIVKTFEGDPNLVNLIAFNETYQNIQFLKNWDKCQKDTYLEDQHESFLLYYLTTKIKRNISKSVLGDAMTEIAHRKIVRPIRDWLDSLEWDKVPRLGTWLHKYAGADFNEYTGNVGKIILTAAVARIYEPGIKFDNIMILEGIQGSGKSTLVNTIGGDWYLDMTLKDSDKDIIDELRGCWIVELGELNGFNKKDVDWLKSFLSRKVDRCRLSYGRRSKDFPRQVIFIGTMNPSGDNTYFKDDTGNRRFWPIACHKIDIPGLKLIRQQLFAEAVQLYKQRLPLYLTGKALQDAEEEQARREITDPWQEDVQRLIAQKPDVTINQVLEMIHIPASQRGTWEAVRIGKILKKIGWHKHQRSDGERVYTRNEVKEQGRYAKKEEQIQWQE